MHYYDPTAIKEYTRNVQIACQRSGVAARFPEESWDGNAKHVTDMFNEFSNKSTHRSPEQNLEAYAQAIYLAAGWLEKVNLEKNEKQLTFITTHVENLKKKVNEIISEDITPPKATIAGSKGIFESLRHLVATSDEMPTPTVQQFFNSDIFKDLERYKNFLQQDTRNHGFGFFAINQEKYKLLNEFIEVLAAQKTMDGIKNTFKQFYEEHDTSGKYTRYDIINTGQDLLTYILGLFGLKKTTSATLLDELDKFSKNLNEPSPEPSVLEKIFG